jgi:hypothetical protein
MIGKESLQLVKRSRLAFRLWHPAARRACAGQKTGPQRVSAEVGCFKPRGMRCAGELMVRKTDVICNSRRRSPDRRPW